MFEKDYTKLWYKNIEKDNLVPRPETGYNII